jgi:hypothetical protein
MDAVTSRTLGGVLDRGALEELRDKYVTMLAMRRRHDAGTEDATDVKREMAQLAARYPGALREIDDLELREIEARIDALDAAIAGQRQAEPWMQAAARFHALARGALCAKRWLGGRRRVDEVVERDFLAALPELAFPPDARAWAGALDAVAAPPRGRLTDAVFARVGRELGLSERAARRLVFGEPRRQRRRRS